MVSDDGPDNQLDTAADVPVEIGNLSLNADGATVTVELTGLDPEGTYLLG